MKKLKENLCVVVACIILLALIAVFGTSSTDASVRTEEMAVKAVVTYVLKTSQYVATAKQWLYTVRYDIAVEGITKTCVATSYSITPKAWGLEEGDVIDCTLLTTFDSKGEVLSKEIK